MNNHPLHLKALKLATDHRNLESEIIETLQAIDREKLYSKLGYKSLYDYTHLALGFSESVSYSFITVARKANLIPELQKALDDGELTVSVAKRITSVVNNENALDLIQKAQNLTQRELEKEVARINPKLATFEKARFVTESRLELKLGVSENLMKKLRRAQDLESQRTHLHRDLEETLEALVDSYLERKDPVKKAERVLTKNQNVEQQGIERQSDDGKDQSSNEILATQSSLKDNSDMQLSSKKIEEASQQNNLDLPSSRKVEDQNPLSRPKSPSLRKVKTRNPITADVKHQVMLRDQGQCTEKDKSGKRCPEKRWIDVHHIVPKYIGGGDVAENLRLICSSHHKMAHF